MRSTKFLLAIGFAGLVLNVLAPTAQAASYIPKPGDLIKTQSSLTVFLVDDNLQKMPVSFAGYVTRYGNNWSLVKTIADSELGAYNPYLVLGATNSHKSGTLIMYTTNNPTIYLLENGVKHGFTNMQALTSRGYNTSKVEWVGTYETYPTGNIFQ